MPDMRIAFNQYDALISLNDLKASKHQRNIHPKEQIERLALIMKEHGIRHPISVSRRSGQVCFGHGRLKAARLNGWTTFPVIYQDFESDLEEYACVQSDNAIAHWAELDLPAIRLDIEGFGDFDLDLLAIKNLNLNFDKELKAEEPEKEPKGMTLLECPHCGEKFELGQARRIES